MNTKQNGFGERNVQPMSMTSLSFLSDQELATLAYLKAIPSVDEIEDKQCRDIILEVLHRFTDKH